MFDVSETLERLKSDREFLTTVLGTIFFLAIFPAYFLVGNSGSDGSLNAVADYRVDGELEYIELDNTTEYIFDGESLQLSFTTEIIDDASSKNIVGVEVSMSYGEDEEVSGTPTCILVSGQDAPDTISATVTHDSYNGSGEGQNNGGSGSHSLEVNWYNSTILGTTVSGLSKAEIIDELDSKGEGLGEYFVEIAVSANSGNAGPGCERNDEGEEVTYSVKLVVLNLDEVTILTELETETGEI